MPPFLPPTRPVPPPREDSIMFLHPGYADNHGVLLWLPRVDISEHGQMGLHFGTAHTACAIIASNAFDGFLALDDQGMQRVDPPFDSLLFEDEYFFFAGPTAEHKNYPVVPTFREWQFPRNRIPETWRQAMTNTNTGTILGDRNRCALTYYSTAVEGAHLVPRVETDWFERNTMRCCGLREPFKTIHSLDNILCLRSDVYNLFDNRMLVIVPKRAPTLGSDAPPEEPGAPIAPIQFTAHLLGALDDYYATLHNTVPQYLHPKSTEFLFARFAWAVIFSAKNFLLDGVARKVRVYSASSRRYEEKVMTRQQLFEAYGGGGSQDATPLKKRKRQGSDSEAKDDGSDSSEDSDSSNNAESFWGDTSHAERRARRAQGSSDETAPDDQKPVLDPLIEREIREALQPIVTEVEAQYE